MKHLFIFSLTLLMMSCSPARNQKNMHLHFNWKMAGEIPDSSVGLAGPVTGSSNGVLLIGGGSNFPDGAPWEGGTKAFYNKVYILKKKGAHFLQIGNTATLPYKVAYSANCTTDSGVIVAGGENKEGALDKVLLLRWDKKTDSLLTEELPALPQPLSSGAIAAIGNDIYLAGGQNENRVSDQLYHLSLMHPKEGWSGISTLPKPVTHTVLYAARGRLYIVGGRKRNIDSTSTLYKDVYQFDLTKKEWRQEASLPYALSAHTGMTLNDSTLLVFSGDQGKTFHQTEVLIDKIAREKDPAVREQLITKKNELQKHHPGFSGEVLAYDSHENSWQRVDSIPFPGQVTTTAVAWGKDQVVIPGGEIRAGVRTAHIVLGRLK